MTENERVKSIRECLRLGQIEFAAALDIKQGSLSMIESGKTGVSKKILFSLREKYNVNPAWIESGVGEKFLISDNPNDPNMDAKEKEIEMLRELLKSKEEIIKSKDETIEALRGQSRSDYKGKSRQA